jgi:uncharacterized protein YqgQ
MELSEFLDGYFKKTDEEKDEILAILADDFLDYVRQRKPTYAGMKVTLKRLIENSITKEQYEAADAWTQILNQIEKENEDKKNI